MRRTNSRTKSETTRASPVIVDQQGVGGGVGSAALDLESCSGAGYCCNLQRREKLDGADDLINYRTGDLRQEMKKLRGSKGVDVVYDPVGGDLSEPAFRSLGWKGAVSCDRLRSRSDSGLIPQLDFAEGCLGYARHQQVHRLSR
jgi:NADPH:quinone reductase-like Zn-dependent oxidoreductase